MPPLAQEPHALESQPLLLSPKVREEAVGRRSPASLAAGGRQQPGRWRWLWAVGACALFQVCGTLANFGLRWAAFLTQSPRGDAYYDPSPFFGVSALVIAAVAFALADVCKLVPPMPAELTTHAALKRLFAPAMGGHALGFIISPLVADKLGPGTSAVLVSSLALPLLALALWLPRVETPNPTAAAAVALASVGGGLAVASWPLKLNGGAVAMKVVAIAVTMGSLALTVYLMTHRGLHPLHMLKIRLMCEGLVVLTLSSVWTQPSAALPPIFSHLVLFAAVTAIAGAQQYLKLWLLREWSGLGFMMVQLGIKAVLVASVAIVLLGDFAVATAVGTVMMLAGCGLYGWARYATAKPAV